MVDDSADRQEASPQSAAAGGVASTSAAGAQSAAAGAGADARSEAVGSDEDAASTERRSAGGSSLGRGRRIVVLVLIWGTTVLAVLGMFAVWANRQLLNPDNWANTSTKLLQNADVRTALPTYLVDQLYANVNVAAELKARLPPVLKPLAGPVAGGLQNVAVSAAERALASPRGQEAWKQANRAADQTLVSIVNGGKGAVQINGGKLTLNLASIVADITNRLGLPDLASKLPPSVANLTILKSNQIKFVQDAGKALKGLALLLTILVPLLYVLAIVLAPGRRRRTLMSVGFAIVLAGVLVFAARSIVESAVVNSLVKVEANKPAADAVISIATSMLSEIAGAFVIVGVPLIAAAWFAGPARLAVRGRRAIAPFLRDQAALTFGIVVLVMVLIFIWGPIPATHRPAGIIVFLALALVGTEVLRRQTAAEFPDPHAGAGTVTAAASEGGHK
jgi:hypothetical protein